MAATITNTTRRVHVGTALSNVAQTLLTFGASLIAGGGVLQAIQLVNNGSSNRVVTIYVIPSGQVAAAQYLIFRDTVPANMTMSVPGGPWFAESSAFIQALQDAGTDVTAKVTAFEEA